MKLIRDIRLYESDVSNVDGAPLPSNIGRLYHYDLTDCSDVLQRLLFLLRHREFCYDGFDHLYLNFTPLVPHGEVRDTNRHTIAEFSWFHYVDVGCDANRFHAWTTDEQTAFILDAVKNASLLKAPAEQRELFADSFDEVLKKGDSLLLPYRRKGNGEHTVEIFVRITDELDFLPLVRVTDGSGAVVAEQELPSCGREEFITQIGSIVIGKRSVRISPRKNYDAEYYGLEPVILCWQTDTI